MHRQQLTADTSDTATTVPGTVQVLVNFQENEQGYHFICSDKLQYTAVRCNEELEYVLRVEH